MNIISVPRKKTILVVSRDPQLADVRKTILESIGFQVHAASDLFAVSKHCREGTLDLIMVGYSLPPAEKRRIWAEVREHCPTPILELHRGETPSLMQAAYFHKSQSPDDFLETVKNIFRKKK